MPDDSHDLSIDKFIQKYNLWKSQLCFYTAEPNDENKYIPYDGSKVKSCIMTDHRRPQRRRRI